MTKRCFKCKQELRIDDFYSHPQMGDGRLGKCKECTKNDTTKRYFEKMNDPDWKEKERERGREKSLDRLGKLKRSGDIGKLAAYRERQRKSRFVYHERLMADPVLKKKFDARRLARIALKKGTIVRPLACSWCGSIPMRSASLHMHHDDYFKPLAIRWLCAKCHGREHRKKDF